MPVLMLDSGDEIPYVRVRSQWALQVDASLMSDGRIQLL